MSKLKLQEKLNSKKREDCLKDINKALKKYNCNLLIDTTSPLNKLRIILKSN